ncbi:MAG: PIN domain-containing protein [Treponema sp.]|nr:PIN domain-containing protein [Treponema sp.]
MDLLIDANVIIDYFTNREQKSSGTDALFEYIYAGKLSAYIAAHTVPTVWYVLRKTLAPDERRNLLRALFSCFSVSPLGERELMSALNRNDFPDFEDCVQDECAANVHARYIITRNKKDFARSKIPALLPEEFIRLM